MFLGLLVALLHADSLPVEFRRLEALARDSWVIEAEKDGVVGPTSSIQTDEVALVQGLAVNRKEKKKCERFPDTLH